MTTPSRREHYTAFVRALLTQEGADAIEFDALMIRPQHGLFSAELVFSRLPPETPQNSRFLLVINDTTAKQKVLHELALSAQVFEHSGEPIMITDPNDRILAVNNAFTEMTGYAIDEVIGATPDFLRQGLGEEAVYRQMWVAVNADNHWGGEVFNRKRSGEAYPTWLSISAVRDKSDNISHYISIFSDISAHSHELHKLRHLAAHDFLTGLPNRTLLEDRFGQGVAGLKRKSAEHIAVLFLDLDGFKLVNDNHGHEFGDALLKHVGEALRSCVREQDTVCRYGGDEFIILLSELTSADVVKDIADTVLHSVAALCQQLEQIDISASIGISFFPKDAETLPELLELADKAMYCAKQSGKNRYCICGTHSSV